jgi:phosphoglycerate kinase
MQIKSFRDEDLKNKIVLLRTDYNVPTTDKVVVDTTRIDESIPTIEALLKMGAKIIIITHRGRPKGKIDISLSMEPIARELEKKINKNVRFINKIDEDIAKHQEEVFLFENIRFFPQEELNDNRFAEELSRMGQIYINDAFAASHRKHASLSGLPKFLPSFFGLCMEKEILALDNIFSCPISPVVAIIGGSKISTKIQLLESLIRSVDKVIIGGAMANTFLKATSNNIGSSLFETSCIDIASNIMNLAKKENVKLVLPVDAKVSKKLGDFPNAKNKILDEIEIDDMILDLGVESSKIILDEISDANTVIWNGPLGAIEYKPFEQSTVAVAKELALRCKDRNSKVIVGGGDTIYGINIAGTYEDYTHVSTGGGAFLQWLEGKDLPAVKAILNKH